MKQILAFVLACLVGFCALAQTEDPDSVANTVKVTEIMIVEDLDDDNGSNYVYEAPDVQPEYPGGINALMAFLSQNISYPEDAMEQNIQGRVMVRFVVTKDGNVSDVEVTNSVYPSLDAEAVRVVKLMKGWKPGEFNGQKVNVWFSLPISFKLQHDLEEMTIFDAVEIDSIGYREMMDYGVKAEAEKNYPHARAYFKEAFHINPYDLTPIDKIETINNTDGKQSENLGLYKSAAYELFAFSRSKGWGTLAIPVMENLADRVFKMDPDDYEMRDVLLRAYFNVESESNFEKAIAVAVELTKIAYDKKQYELLVNLLNIRTAYLLDAGDFEGIINLVEPYLPVLEPQDNTSWTYYHLSRAYDATGEKSKGTKYLNIARGKDSNNELPR